MGGSITRPGRALAGALAGAAVITAAGCARSPADVAVPASATATAGGKVPASAIGRLTAIAPRAAVSNGDPHPAWVIVVATTRARALTSATPGDFVPVGSRARVFLITLRGRFTDRMAPGPPGSAPPAGRYVSLVLSARTFGSLDFGLARRPPPVAPSSLGPVTRLRW